MFDLPLVSFGIINCNRLHYAKSCLYSLLETTKDYNNKEIIFIDNASVEDGTAEFLSEIANKKNITVFKQDKRDPHNEFAKALNIFCREAKGSFLVPLQGDMQFILNGWLSHYVDFYSKNIDKVGCIILDAQRNITNNKHSFSCLVGDELNFLYDFNRNPIAGAGDVFYSREVVEKIFPWHEANKEHEGSQDSETAMLTKIRKLLEHNKFLEYRCATSLIPPASAIYTDARGTNERIRGNKRYGDYWAPKKDFFYYEILDYKEQFEKYKTRIKPVGLEDIVKPIGFDLPIDFNGNLLKNPIRPETASTSDYVVLYEEENKIITAEEKYLDDWLGE